jgi:SAM-dependent methyltransferase
VTFRKTIISEASDLNGIESNSYDFVASSNVIEHLTNPLRALLEMKRVVRPGGLVIAIVPHKDVTFDHRRPVTSLDSLIQIFKNNPLEGDVSHLDLDEIFRDYDLELDLTAGDLDSFKKRTFNNKQNRALHQTVFDTQLLLEMFNWAEMKILFVRTSLILGHVLVIAEKTNDSSDEIQKSNLHFLSSNADWRNYTIFRSERIKKEDRK